MYRDDLTAALQRIEALEAELREKNGSVRDSDANHYMRVAILEETITEKDVRIAELEVSVRRLLRAQAHPLPDEDIEHPPEPLMRVVKNA